VIGQVNRQLESITATGSTFGNYHPPLRKHYQGFAQMFPRSSYQSVASATSLAKNQMECLNILLPEYPTPQS
jgi:hypothetical protein